MEHVCIKKALLIGINYLNTSKELAGCINDMLNIKCKLISDYKFLESDITVMTDNTNIQPTKINILNTLKNILLKLEANDILFFAFSFIRFALVLFLKKWQNFSLKILKIHRRNN